MFYLILITLLLFSCGENKFQADIDFRRSPSFFRIQVSDFKHNQENLLTASWRTPQATEGLEGYYLILDTNHWNDTKGLFYRFNLQTSFNRPVIFIPWNNQTSDSVFFLLDNISSSFEKAKTKDNIPFFKIDSNQRINPNKIDFTFALVAAYTSGLPGETRFSLITIGDLFSPQIILSQIHVLDSQITIQWQRPLDRTNFFNSDINADTGLIKGYHIIIEDQDNSNLISFNPLNLKSILLTTAQDTLLLIHSDLASILISEDNPSNRGKKVTLFLKDSVSHKQQDQLNQIQLTLTGLFPEQAYRYFIYAEDHLGNFNLRDAERRFFTTTDNTKPTSIIINETSQTQQNQVTLLWKSSKDTRPQDFLSNGNILQYFVEITEQTGHVSFPSVLLTIPQEHDQDSLILNQNIIYYPSSTNSLFQLERYFLIPNTTISFKIWSQDSSLHLSDTSTASFFTPPLLDTLQTAFRCPTGFSPIITQDTFCIQSYEFQNSQFVTEITLQDAIESCQNLSSAQDSVFLCSEKQWERACQGHDNSLVYGVQSIDNSKPQISLQPSDLQNLCNIETGNLTIAQEINRRNPQCVTNEGIYDLAGNYSEWVQSTNGELIFKGTNYLRTPSNSFNQERTECLFDASPQQFRPNYSPSCISEQANLSFILNNNSLICPSLNKPIKSFEWITKIIYGINSPKSGVRFVFEDNTQDSIFFADLLGNPIVAKTGKINTQNLLVVKFQNKKNSSLFVFDTLDFNPFLFFDSPVSLGEPSSHLLLSQITNSNWDAIPTQILYSTFIRNSSSDDGLILKPAKKYYNHEALGFRCCSKSR